MMVVGGFFGSGWRQANGTCVCGGVLSFSPCPLCCSSIGRPPNKDEVHVTSGGSCNGGGHKVTRLRRNSPHSLPAVLPRMLLRSDTRHPSMVNSWKSAATAHLYLLSPDDAKRLRVERLGVPDSDLDDPRYLHRQGRVALYLVILSAKAGTKDGGSRWSCVVFAAVRCS